MTQLATQLPRYNLARGVKTVSQAQSVADVLIPKGGGGGDGFWTKSAQNLLAACLLRYDNIGDIYNDFSDSKKMATRLGEFVDDAQRLAGSFVNAVSDSDGKFATNVIATLSTSLAGWADTAIRNSTETSDFDARDLVNPERPSVLILACPGNARRVIAPSPNIIRMRQVLERPERHKMMVGHRNDNVSFSHLMKLSDRRRAIAPFLDVM